LDGGKNSEEWVLDQKNFQLEENINLLGGSLTEVRTEREKGADFLSRTQRDCSSKKRKKNRNDMGVNVGVCELLGGGMGGLMRSWGREEGRSRLRKGRA